MSIFKHYIRVLFSKTQFQDKRDKDNTIILFDAEKILTKIINKEIAKIEQEEIFKILSTYYNKKYLKAYFSKVLKDISTIHHHKLFIINYDKSFDKKFLSEKGNFIIKLLKFLHFVRFKIRNIKNFIKFSFFETSSFNESITKNCEYNNNPKIGICFVEGINESRRSDIYWKKNAKIKDEDIIIYGNNIPTKITEQNIHKLTNKKNNFNFVELPNANSNSLSLKSKKIIQKIKSFKSKTIDEIWLKTISIMLIQKINFWEIFFKNFNIKIHMDHSENNPELFFKQIAIKSNGGVSIGKMRSYPMKSFFYNYYPNDIFFVYGKDSYNQFSKTNNPINNYVISGYPYNVPKIKLNLNNKFSKTLTILILDNNYGYNKGAYWQNIYTDYLKNLYYRLFELLIKNNKISIIVKPKKYNRIPINKELLHDAKSTNRLKIIEDGRGFMPISLVPFTDLVISTGVFISGSMMECVASNARAVFCDYANLEKEVPHLYKAGNKKIIFQNINEMLKKLEDYILEPNKNNDFGNWEKYIDIIDPFRDNLGSQRIGNYINSLQKGFKNKLSVEKNIINSNQEYIEKFSQYNINYRGDVIF